MCADLTPLSHCVLTSNRQQSVIAFHGGEWVKFSRFKQDVTSLIPYLLQLKQENIAIFYHHAYPFSFNLFALLHSKKKIWIAANNTSATADQLIDKGCLLLGEWQGREVNVSLNRQNQRFKTEEVMLDPLDLKSNQIIIFTSGSSGQAKEIIKSLLQFQTEIETLENYWGEQLAEARVLATVSHQHIYGLLFRVLWPLAAGRCFHSEMYLSPEPLLNNFKTMPAYWVASPAQLKRLDELTPWQEISKLVTIFSSGGALSLKAAVQIKKRSGHKVIEIYGSSEAGGIAWRRQANNRLWKLFDKINLTANNEQIATLISPYLPPQTILTLDDKIQLYENGHFALLGRVDRIVKVEEKRLSLDELEQSLDSCQWIQQSHTFIIKNKRDKISAVVVLTQVALKMLQQQGRKKLIKRIREYLLNKFESVLLPRQWLFMQTIPYNAQGKINQQLLTELCSLDSTRFPQVLNCNFQDHHVELDLKVFAKLIYFSGHFPEHPILPGVTQIAWVEQFGKIFFNMEQPFLRMEVIKFKKIICPGDTLLMKLNWKENTGKLYFEINSVNDSHSSGRLIYGQQE